MVTTGWRAHVSSGQCPQQWDIPAIVSSTQLHCCSNYGHVRRQLQAPELLSCYQSHLLSVQLQGGMRDLQYMYRRGEEKLMGTGSAILRWNIDNHSTVTINSVETARNVALSMILNILHRLMIRHGSYYATGQHYCLVTAFLFLFTITTPPSRIMNIMQARAAAAMRAMRVVVG